MLESEGLIGSVTDFVFGLFGLGRLGSQSESDELYLGLRRGLFLYLGMDCLRFVCMNTFIQSLWSDTITLFQPDITTILIIHGHLNGLKI